MRLTDDDTCPHCGTKAYTDDGPYGDDNTEERECGECERPYTITASVRISWRTYCLPPDHDYEVSPHNTGLHAQCKKCEEYAFSDIGTRQDEYQLAAFDKHRRAVVEEQSNHG